MTKNEIWFSKKLEMLFYTGFASCFNCQKIIEYQGVIVRRTSEDKQHFFCMDCSKKISQDVFLTRFIHMTDTPPSDCIPIFRDSIEISSVTTSKKDIIVPVSVWDDAAIKQSKDKEKIVDNAFQSHNKDFMIQSDAKNPLSIESSIADKDSEHLLDDKGLDGLADSYYKDIQLLGSMDELDPVSDDDNIPVAKPRKRIGHKDRGLLE
jgi:hypothetical protein